jgi:hypothetical protein
VLTKIFILLLRSVTVDRKVFHKPPLAIAERWQAVMDRLGDDDDKTKRNIC